MKIGKILKGRNGLEMKELGIVCPTNYRRGNGEWKESLSDRNVVICEKFWDFGILGFRCGPLLVFSPTNLYEVFFAIINATAKDAKEAQRSAKDRTRNPEIPKIQSNALHTINDLRNHRSEISDQRSRSFVSF